MTGFVIAPACIRITIGFNDSFIISVTSMTRQLFSEDHSYQAGVH